MLELPVAHGGTSLSLYDHFARFRFIEYRLFAGKRIE